MNKTEQPKRTASQAMNERSKNALAMIEKLKAYVKKESANKNANWGDVGSIAHIEEKLASLIEFIGE